MITATMNVDHDLERYIDQVYEKQHAGLLRYFRVQLGNISEAEDCVQETIYRFFLFMKGRCWDKEMEYISVRLMKRAGILCMEKLREKQPQSMHSLDDSKSPDSFNEIKAAAINSIKERLRVSEFPQITTGAWRGDISLTL